MSLVESEEIRNDFSWIPKLMTAVLLQACRDIQKTRRDVQRRKDKDGNTREYVYSRMRHPNAKEWFLSEDKDTFSLHTVCQVLGIKRSTILERLAPYICPALASRREKYDPGRWRNTMRDGRLTKVVA